MEKKKFFARKGMKLNFILALILLLTLLVCVFAWLFYDTGQKPYTGVSNFNLAGEIYFEQEDGTRIDSSKHLEDGLLQINVTDEKADNYLGKLRVDVKYTGYSPAYVRVRILEQWIDHQTDTLQPVQYIPYTLYEENGKSHWMDNRTDDLYFYYDQLISSSQTKEEADAATEKTIPLVQGVEDNFLSGIRDGAASLYLIITVDGVQPNRYQQFWNIETLPWERNE